MVDRFRTAEAELTQWVLDHPDEAKSLVVSELKAETNSAVKPELIAHAWPRIRLTDTASRTGIELFVTRAKDAGLLKSVPDLAKLVIGP